MVKIRQVAMTYSFVNWVVTYLIIATRDAHGGEARCMFVMVRNGQQ